MRTFLPKKSILNQKGIAHLFLILFILAALALGVYLVQTRTNINPFAQSVSGPVSGPVTDSDKDGFTDSQENFMGTNPNKACADNQFDNAWPVDVNNDKYVNGGDVSTLVPFINGTNPYGRRYDLNQDSKIDQRDITVIQSNFLKTCEPIQKTARFVLGMHPIAKIGEEVEIFVAVSNWGEPVNLISAQINYPADKLDVVKMVTEGSDQVSTDFNNTIEKFAANGKISIVKGSTTGVNPASINTGIMIARITFKVKGYGRSEINLNTATSEILRVKDGANVINTDDQKNASITVYPPASATPAPSSGCTSDTQCGSGKVCRRYQNYPGNCVDEHVACAQAIVTACDPATKCPAGAQCLRAEVCVDFPNICVVPPGWTITGGGRPTLPPAPTPSPVVTPTAVPTPVATACVINKGEWVNNSLVPSNSTAQIRIEATGNCTNKTVIIDAWEDDGVLGNDNILVQPQQVVLVSSGQPNTYVATTTWTTEFQEDGPFGTSYPPEFAFSASVEGSGQAVYSANKLTVSREVGAPSPVEGDTNRDGQVNLKDMSWLLANWDKKVDDSLDLAGNDGLVNNFDMTKLKSILLQRGVLKSPN